MTSRMNAAIDSAKRSHQASILVEADLIAVANDDGVTSVKVTDSDTVNLVWAKLRGQEGEIVQAYNGRVTPRAKLPVWLRHLPDGTYEVEGARSRDGSDYVGEALGTMNIPELIGELMAVVWGARNLKPGRVRLSDLGGMYIHIEPFFYNGVEVAPDDLDLTANIPATASTHAWAGVWYDPDGGTLGATTGTEYSLTYTLTDGDSGGLSISPNYIPLAKVELFDTTTAIATDTRMVAWQTWITAPISSNTFFPIHITDARTIPTNSQQVVDRVFVEPGGILTVNGILRAI